MLGARRSTAVLESSSPGRKWRAILISTLLLVPAYWGIVAGLVAAASEDPEAPAAGPPIAFGLALVPFVFVALAFLSHHPRAPSAALRAMGLSLLVGIPAAALLPDAISGLIAGIGAGGAAALRPEPVETWRARGLAVLSAAAFVFVMVRIVPDVAVLLAPSLPFTSLGIADHVTQLREQGHGAPR